MRRGNQVLEFLGSAVCGIGRERQHAVVAPVAKARKIRYRHQFDRRHSKGGKIVQPRFHTRERAFRGESSYMQFIDDSLFPWPAAPIPVRPIKGARVHHHAG